MPPNRTIAAPNYIVDTSVYSTTTSSTWEIPWDIQNVTPIPPIQAHTWWNTDKEFQAPNGAILPKTPLTNYDYMKYMEAEVDIPIPEVQEICVEQRRKRSEEQREWLRRLNELEATIFAPSPVLSSFTDE